MNIISKLRIAFLAQYIVGFIFLCLLILVFQKKGMFENFENNYKIWTIIITLFIIPTIVLLNLISKNTINFVKEIELYDDGFMIKFFLFKKNEFIKYNLISNISYHKSYSNAGSGRINDGYFVSTIEFKNNRILNISSNKFENYYEMVNFIKTKV